MPDHTRVIWASGEPREFWMPRIQQASQDWLKIEQLTLLEGLRDSILIFLQKDQVAEKKKWCAQNGFELVLLEAVPQNNSYSSYGSNGTVTKENHSYRAAITKKEYVGDWYDAWRGSDNKKIGQLLGYPECCQNFFEKYWVQEQWRDLTYPAYKNSPNGASGPIEANILGRWIGIRWVSHMPCSFQCEHSVKIGKETRELAEALGFKESAAVIDEVLSWNMKWSALHGIAEIKTPVYKVSAATEATGQELLIERSGKQPDKKASGLGFPFQNRRSKPYTEGKSFRRSIEALTDPDVWEDNGFSTKDAMIASHEPLLHLVPKEVESVVDFGCGNGHLLQCISEQSEAQLLVGYELDPEKVTRGKLHYDNIRLQDEDMFDVVPEPAELAIVMAGRLLEVTKSQRQQFIEQLTDRYKFVIFYLYGDWKDRFESIENLLEKQEISHRFIVLDEAENDHTKAIRCQVL